MRDKDLILTKDGYVFYARGYQKDEGIDVILKYLPSAPSKWSFKFRGKYYTRNVTNPNIDFLCKNPQYYSPFSKTLLHVKKSQISTIFEPVKKYHYLKCKKNLDKLEKMVIEIGNVFESNGINENYIGITGSILLGCHNVNYSDIDFVIIGRSNLEIAIEIFKENKKFKQFSHIQWKKYYETYHIANQYNLNFRDFLKTAKRKCDRVYYLKKRVSLLNVRNDTELKREKQRLEEIEINLLKVKASGEIVSNDESSFFPSYYKVSVDNINPPLNVEIRELRALGREYYLEGFAGDKFECEGRLQLVIPKKGKKYFRIEIGYLGDNLLPQGYLKIL